MNKIMYDFTNLKSDLLHWFEKYPFYFPWGARYLKKTQPRFEMFGNLYVSKMISKYKKCCKKGILDEEAFFTTGLACIYGKGTKTNNNDAFHILMTLFDNTSNPEPGFIVLMIILMIIFSNEGNEDFQEMLQAYTEYFKENIFAPVDFVLGAYYSMGNSKEVCYEFLERAMDGEFALAYAYCALFIDNEELKQRGIKGVDASLNVEERFSLFAKGNLLLEQAIKNNDDNLGKKAGSYIKKAGYLGDIFALGSLALFYMDEKFVSYINETVDYDTAYIYACKAEKLNLAYVYFYQARLHLENLITNANKEHGEFFLGKALFYEDSDALKYAKERNYDPQKLIDNYVELVS